MPAATITPAFVRNVAAAVSQLSAGPPATEEWKVNVRVTNKTATDRKYTFVVTASGDATFTAGHATTITIPANDARDVELDLPIPSGFKLGHSAEVVNALDVRLSGRKRQVTP